jgi:hypothetical protein
MNDNKCICHEPKSWGHICPVHNTHVRANENGEIEEIRVCDMNRVLYPVKGYPGLYHICEDCKCQR